MKNVFLGCFLVLFVAKTYATKIVGYVQVYQGTSTSIVDNIQFDKLTDVIYAFATFDGNGNISIVNQSVFNVLLSEANSNGVAVRLAVGGAGLSSNFGTVSASGTARTKFANNCAALISQYNLAGIDIDWEFPSNYQAGNVASLCSAVKNAIGNAELSIAVAPIRFNSGGINNSTINTVDFINVMAYDDDRGTQHSSYAFSQEAINYWTNSKGAPASKLRLGVPFYGKIGVSFKTYNQLVSSNPATNSKLDLIDGYNLNGQITMTQKSNYVLSQGLDGIMIWSVEQDYTAADQYSLLKAINDVIGSGVSCSNPNLGFTKSLCGETSVLLDANVPIGNGFSGSWTRNGSSIPGVGSSLSVTQEGNYCFKYSHNGNCPDKSTCVDVTSSTVVQTEDGEVCESGTVLLKSLSGSVKWYNQQNGGTLLNTGSEYTTPILSKTTTYYLESSAVSESVGISYDDGTAGDFNTGGYTPTTSSNPALSNYRALNFNVLSDYTINEVSIYVQSAGSVTIKVKNGLGALKGSKTVSVVPGKNVIPLNIDVTTGNNYLMEVDGDIWLNPKYSGAIYGTTVPGIIKYNHMQTKNGFAVSTTQYLGLYDIQVAAGGSCGARTPIIATVNSGCTPPVISNLIPAGGTLVESFDEIEISADVTDNVGLSDVKLNVYIQGNENPISTPDLTLSGSSYSSKFTPTSFVTYIFEFVATDTDDNVSVKSVNYTVSQDGTGISNNFDKNVLGLYPNPALDVIELSTTKNVSFMIFQVNGTKVFEGKTTGSIDVSMLKSGIYIVQIQDEDSVVAATFVKK